MSITAACNTLGNILSGPTLRLPLYQRPYVWFEAAEKLLADLLEAFERPDGPEYFIGNLLMVEQPGTIYRDLADGQQRLTTLFLLLSCLRARCARHADTQVMAGWLEKRLLDWPDYKTAAPRLSSPRKPVAELLTAIATTGTLPASILPEHKAQVAQYEKVLKSINTWLDTEMPKPAAAEKFAQFLCAKVTAVVITYPDDGTALSVFENINAKGSHLFQSDRLKSAFMKMAADEAEWPGIDKAWEGILSNANARKGGLDGFLRKASMTMIFDAIQKPSDAPCAKDLLVRLTKHCKDHQVQTATVLQKLAQFAEAQVAFENQPPKYICTRGNDESSDVLRRIRTLPSHPEFVSTMVAALPAHLALSCKNQVVAALEAVACAVSLTKATKNINYVMQPFCVELRSLEDAQISSFCRKLLDAQVVPRLTSLRDALLRLSPGGAVTDTRWAKYLLCIAESELRRGLEAAELSYAGDKSQVKLATLEHIIPQADLPTHGRDLIFSLGNCTLLEAGKNKSLKDSTFAVKAKMYPSSDFRLTKELLGGQHGVATTARKFLDQPDVAGVWNYPDFSANDIPARAEGLVQLLFKIWQVELSSGTLAAPPSTPPADASMKACPAPTASAQGEPEEADVGSWVHVTYEGRPYHMQLVAADVNDSVRNKLNARVEPGSLLRGKCAGATIRGALFGGRVADITVVRVD